MAVTSQTFYIIHPYLKFFEHALPMYVYLFIDYVHGQVKFSCILPAAPAKYTGSPCTPPTSETTGLWNTRDMIFQPFCTSA